jgi:hypothetical protein
LRPRSRRGRAQRQIDLRDQLVEAKPGAVAQAPELARLQLPRDLPPQPRRVSHAGRTAEQLAVARGELRGREGLQLENLLRDRVHLDFLLLGL